MVNIGCAYVNRRRLGMTRENRTGTPRLHNAGLRRDLQILSALADDDSGHGLGVNQLAEIVGRDKAQVSRVLATLAQEGLVSREAETPKYRIGWKIFWLAARTVETSLADLTAPFLREIVAGLHETTPLCVLRGGRVLTLLSEIPSHAFRGLNWQGGETPPHSTSAGRVLLSERSDGEIRDWWRDRPRRSGRTKPTALPQEGRPSRAMHTTTDIETFVELLRQTQANDFASVDEEFEPGLVGVSAPIRDFRGRIIAAINVAAPKTRLGAHLFEAGTYIRGVAARLSQELGYSEGGG